MTSFVVCLLIALAVAWLLVAPHLSAELRPGMRSDAAGADASLTDQKERCLNVLRDLELDFTTGKISEEDYRITRAQLSRELGDLLSRLDAGAQP